LWKNFRSEDFVAERYVGTSNLKIFAKLHRLERQKKQSKCCRNDVVARNRRGVLVAYTHTVFTPPTSSEDKECRRNEWKGYVSIKLGTS
jgi:hypothetical protein